MSQTTSSYVSVTDIFCGAGGFTTGALAAGAEVIAAANHWGRAIETHNTNYPHIDHFLADVSLTNPRTFPKSTGLICSPECTSQTLAKGRKRKHLAQADMFAEGDPLPDEAEERSRCTMNDPLKLAAVHNYEFVILENVVDVHYWSEWERWMRDWEALDYVLQFVYLNSMFAHPTPQSRDRIYIVATKRRNRRPNLSITPRAYCQQCSCDVESVQSWKNPLRRYGKYGRSGQYVYCCPQCAAVVQPYYYAAYNAIDWSLPTTRIGDRKRPLEPKTIARIKLGLQRFCTSGTYDPFLIDHLYEYRLREMTRPLATVVAEGNHQSLVQPFVFSMNHAGAQSAGVLNQPLPTRTTYDDTGFVAPPPFLVELRHNSTVRALSDPLATMCASGEHHAVVTPPCAPQPFLINHIQGFRLGSLTDPLNTVCGMHHQSLVTPPPPSLPSSPAWLMTYYSNGGLSPVEEPHSTVTTIDREALVTAFDQQAEKGIDYEDCGFRMLDPREIQAAMAFPASYKITGNRREQVKQLGNACTAPAVETIVRRVLASLDG